MKTNNLFLDFATRANSKTFYYLRIMAYHAIPLIVHNTSYKQDLTKEFYELKSGILKPLIFHVQDEHLQYRVRGKKVIVDDPIVFDFDKRSNLRGIKIHSDDEIRDIILTDYATGHSWKYE